MAIVEITGGPITHHYLMGKTKTEIASMYMRLLHDTEQDANKVQRLADECAMHRKFVWTLLKAAGGSICVQPSVAVSFNHKTAVLDRIPEINGSVTFRASESTPGKHND